jgi:hypothetical protein
VQLKERSERLREKSEEMGVFLPLFSVVERQRFEMSKKVAFYWLYTRVSVWCGPCGAVGFGVLFGVLEMYHVHLMDSLY